MNFLLQRPWRLFPLWAVTVFAACPVGAVAPIGYFNNLVAGGDEAGYRDGPFALARFNSPGGLCFAVSGDKLYVADTGNQRIRVVDLSAGNQVDTLAGTGTPGKDDGPFEKASFNHPSRIAALSNDRLAVYDSGDQLLRLLDLKARKVTTVPGGMAVWDMAYLAKDDCLYLSQRDGKSLQKLDLKALSFSTVFSNNPQIPQPKALCADKDALYVADQDLPTVYRMIWGPAQGAASPAPDLKEAGQADHVQALAFSDGTLYALQAGKEPLVKVASPKAAPVRLATCWGFMEDGNNPSVEPLMDVPADQPVGFAASPTEKRKFLISGAGEDRQSILSVKDYHFDLYWPAKERVDDYEHAMDYDYPFEKPAGTYRIFLVGDSRTYIAPEAEPGSKYDNDWFYGAPRNYTMAKQLELFLNTQAALQGVKTHFEVMEWNRRGMDLSSYADYELTPIVQKYHMDMVLALEGYPGYGDYYMKPMTPEGIPRKDNDYEYMLKPLSKRVPPGAPADLYQRFKKANPGDTEKLGYPGNYSPADFLCKADPDTFKDLVEMTGRPIGLLSKKLQSMDTGDGNHPQLVLFHIPYRGFPDSERTLTFWTEICAQLNLPLIDLTEDFDGLKIGFYPATTACCSGHLTGYGDKLVGYLLSRHLIDGKFIPFKMQEIKP